MRSITEMIGGKNKFKLRKKTLRCRELKNKVEFQLKIFISLRVRKSAFSHLVI